MDKLHRDKYNRNSYFGDILIYIFQRFRRMYIHTIKIDTYFSALSSLKISIDKDTGEIESINHAYIVES